VLQPELAAHGTRSRGTKKRLVQFDSKNPETPTWGPSHSSRTVPSPGLVGWREFWSEIEQCGQVGWPQLIRLPTWIAQTQDSYPRWRVVEMLREAAAIFSTQRGNDEQLVTLEPDADGNYQIPRARADNIGLTDEDRVGADRTDEIADHRQIVFLDAKALKLL
jgi:hypothetical protein